MERDIQLWKAVINRTLLDYKECNSKECRLELLDYLGSEDFGLVCHLADTDLKEMLTLINKGE